MSTLHHSSLSSSGRQSPFRRQPSTTSPSTVRTSTPTSSPTKPSLLSPARGGSLSPEKPTPFVRHPSQNGHTSERASSPFARPNSALGRDAASPSPSPTKGAPEDTEIPTPVRRFGRTESPTPAPPSPFDGTDAFNSPTTDVQRQAKLRPAAQRTLTSSTTSTIRQPNFTPATSSTPKSFPSKSSGSYNQIPAPLLRTFRESFEVLDANNTGNLNSSSLHPTLEQLGLPSDHNALASFFSSSKSQNMNLATYLDTLSAPFSQLSAPDELAAAFSAFDVDDSGQIDVHELREAILRTMPEPGEVNEGARLSEREVDTIFQDFIGRRAFGAKGLGAQKNGNGPRGDVFKWRDFVGNLSGGGMDGTVDATAA